MLLPFHVVVFFLLNLIYSRPVNIAIRVFNPGFYWGQSEYKTSPLWGFNSSVLLTVVEELQVQILRLLLNNKDKTTVCTTHILYVGF